MPITQPERKRHKSLSQSLAESIAADIKSGKLKAGEKLATESAIMEMYDVSRTVVREAISHLRAEGLVKTQHGIGTFIQEPPAQTISFQHQAIITMRDVLDILELRISLETEAAWLAASRRSEEQMAAISEAFAAIKTSKSSQESVSADQRFHQLIAQATGNPYFVNILSNLGGELIPRARLNSAELNHEATESYLLRVNNEHEDICSAILRKDSEGARAAMRTHLSNSRERLREAEQRIQQALTQNT